jgi:hypothetical protein
MAIRLVEDGDRIVSITPFVPRQRHCGLIRGACAEIDNTELIPPIVSIPCQLNKLVGLGAQYGVDTNAKVVGRRLVIPTDSTDGGLRGKDEIGIADFT